MIISKWEWNKKDYIPYKIPDEWNCKTYGEDMAEIINCPHCGEKLELGDSYTSLELHWGLGMGFCVCGKCYAKEWERKRNYECL